MAEEIKPHRRTKYDDYHKSKILKKKKVTFAQEILNQVIYQEETLAIKLEKTDKSRETNEEQIENLVEQFVNTCIDKANLVFQTRDFYEAQQILMISQQILESEQLGMDFPDLKFKNFICMAQMHNLDNDVEQSTSHLEKALQIAFQIENIEGYIIDQDINKKIPLIETYINVANSYLFMKKKDTALKYIESGILACSKFLELLGHRLMRSTFNDELRSLSKYQYHIINLKITALQLKGQLLEKFKRYPEAIVSYQLSKQLIETNYGAQDRKYLEAQNSINGAKYKFSKMHNFRNKKSLQLTYQPLPQKELQLSQTMSDLFNKQNDLNQKFENRLIFKDRFGPIFSPKRTTVSSPKHQQSRIHGTRNLYTKSVLTPSNNNISRNLEKSIITQKHANQTMFNQNGFVTSFDRRNNQLMGKSLKFTTYSRSRQSFGSSLTPQNKNSEKYDYDDYQLSVQSQMAEIKQMQRQQSEMMQMLTNPSQLSLKPPQTPQRIKKSSLKNRSSQAPMSMYFTDFTTPGEVGSYYRPYETTSASDKKQKTLKSSPNKKSRPQTASKFSMVSREDEDQNLVQYPTSRRHSRHVSKLEPIQIHMQNNTSKTLQLMVQNTGNDFIKAYLIAPTNFIKIPIENIQFITCLDPMKKRRVVLFEIDFSAFEDLNASQYFVLSYDYIDNVQYEKVSLDDYREKCKSKSEIEDQVIENLRVQRAAVLIQKWFRRTQFKLHYFRCSESEKVRQPFIAQKYTYRNSKLLQTEALLKVYVELYRDWDHRTNIIYYPISVILIVKNREKELYNTGPILLNYIGYSTQDNPTREDVCNRFSSLLNLIDVRGIPSVDYNIGQFERAYKLSIKDVQDNQLVLNIQNMREEDRFREFNSTKQSKMRRTFNQPESRYPHSSESQFDRQESEHQRQHSDDEQVRVEEANLIAEGMKQMWDGVTYQIQVTHDPKEQHESKVTLIIRNVLNKDETKEDIQLRDKIVSKNNSFIQGVKERFQQIMLSINYSQSTGRPEIDWKHFQKITKNIQ